MVKDKKKTEDEDVLWTDEDYYGLALIIAFTYFGVMMIGLG